MKLAQYLEFGKYPERASKELCDIYRRTDRQCNDKYKLLLSLVMDKSQLSQDKSLFGTF